MAVLLQIIWPILGFLACVVVTFLLERKKRGVVFSITLPGLDWVQIQLPLKRLWLSRVVCLTGALAFSIVPAFRDYSDFFPRQYKMSVFFDETRLQELAKTIVERYPHMFALARDWKKHRAEYFQSLDTDTSRLFGFEGFFQNPERVHSKGVMNFTTEKMRVFQRYRISEAEGYLSHIREEPNKQRKVLITKFELLTDRNAYIDANLYDVYLCRKLVIRPHFNQIITSPESRDSQIHHIVTAVTEIGVCPFPWVSDTIYFLEDKSGLVPIGYAVYEWR